MLVFSCITPHPPVLIPAIGKENLELLEKTKKAFEELAQNLYNTQPEIVIVITPHNEDEQGKIEINQSPVLKADFSSFGDLVTEKSWQGSLGVAYQINEYFETKNVLKLIHEEKIDHGVSVPLFYLTNSLEKTSIIPLTVGGQTSESHYDFGAELARFIKRSDKRIAVVASGDLSHKTSKKSPSGFAPEGKKFDKELIRLLESGNLRDVPKMDPDLVQKARECGLKSFCVLAGILSESDQKAKVLSYEAPFGVGYLVAEFE